SDLFQTQIKQAVAKHNYGDDLHSTADRIKQSMDGICTNDYFTITVLNCHVDDRNMSAGQHYFPVTKDIIGYFDPRKEQYFNSCVNMRKLKSATPMKLHFDA
ncbi:hypothetical protein PMAYCL1PPCAC_26339, partial [Pristionchus mayeri]